MLFARRVQTAHSFSSPRTTTRRTTRAMTVGPPPPPVVVVGVAGPRVGVATTAHTNDQRQQNATPAAAPQQQPPKTVYLIRHGEGFHNIGYDHNLDAHLTPRGWAQTAALQQHMKQTPLGIQLVIVSPLRRTLETAAGVFGQAQAAAASSNVTSSTTTSAATGSLSWVLMNQQAGRAQEVTPQSQLFLPLMPRRAVIAAGGGAAAATVAAAAAARVSGWEAVAEGVGVGDDSSSDSNSSDSHHQPLKLLAHEGCRERIGPNVCDKFRDLHLQVSDFPGVDFSLMQHTTDVAWEQLHGATAHDGGCYWVGEEESACEQRALDFYTWLMDRPESVIAVVSHCGWCVHGMRALSKTMFRTWSEAMMEQTPINTAAAAAAGTQPQQPLLVNGGSSTAAAPTPTTTAPDSIIPPAEVLRQSAAALGGWMQSDWSNCECRSIQLRWGDKAQLLLLPTTGGNTDKAEGVSSSAVGGFEGRFLWATPGDASTWWQGGSQGLI